MSVLKKDNAYGGEYTEHTTVSGVKLRVFTPPLALIAGVLPDWEEPQVPLVSMETKGGVQKRLAKKGDPEFAAYEVLHDKWELERHELAEAAKLVTALRTFEYPKELILEAFPPHVQDLVSAGLLSFPAHVFLRKMMYLEATALEAQNDKYEVNFIIQLRSGVDPEVVAQIKKNFRDSSLRIFAGSLAEENGSSGAGATDEGNSNVEDGVSGT